MIIYEPLNKTLQKKGMKRTDLLCYMSSATLAKLANNENMSMKTIDTICKALNCRIEDVAVFIDDENEQTKIEQ